MADRCSLPAFALRAWAAPTLSADRPPHTPPRPIAPPREVREMRAARMRRKMARHLKGEEQWQPRAPPSPSDLEDIAAAFRREFPRGFPGTPDAARHTAGQHAAGKHAPAAGTAGADTPRAGSGGGGGGWDPAGRQNAKWWRRVMQRASASKDRDAASAAVEQRRRMASGEAAAYLANATREHRRRMQAVTGGSFSGVGGLPAGLASQLMSCGSDSEVSISHWEARTLRTSTTPPLPIAWVPRAQDPPGPLARVAAGSVRACPAAHIVHRCGRPCGLPPPRRWTPTSTSGRAKSLRYP